MCRWVWMGPQGTGRFSPLLPKWPDPLARPQEGEEMCPATGTVTFSSPHRLSLQRVGSQKNSSSASPKERWVPWGWTHQGNNQHQPGPDTCVLPSG